MAQSSFNITIDQTPSPLERTLIASAIAVTSSASLLSYFVLFSTIVYSKKLRSNSFYQVLFSLAVNDALCQFSYLAVAAPMTFIGFDYSPTFDIVVNVVALQVAWFHYSLLLLFQSFNRLLFLCYPHKYDRFFGGHRIWYYIATSWAVGLAMGVSSFWPCCQFSYFLSEYSFDNAVNASGSVITDYVDIGYSSTNLILVLIVHVSIFYDVYRRGRTIQSEATQFQQLRWKREKRLLVQLFVGTSLLVVDVLVSIVPAVSTSRFGGFFTSMVEIIAMAANGVVFLFFNETVNGEAKAMLMSARRVLFCRHDSSSVIRTHHTTHHNTGPLSHASPRHNSNAIVAAQDI